MNAARKKGGFTLVELLVVIAIIGMVTALAVPTIFGAISSARNAKTKAELDMLHMAIMNYKNEYGSFPPAYFGPIPANPAPIALDNANYKKHPVYRHLTRVFPRLSESQAAFAAIANLSPAQALVFWLSGFYENPEYPLTNGPTPTPGRRKKLYDFDESRLYAASVYQFNGTPQTFAPRDATTVYPVYFTGHPSCGLPYVYFDSRCYDDGPGSDINYAALNTAGDPSIASTYINSLPPANGTWAQQHMGADTFQLIAAGKDGLFGGSSINKAAYPCKAPYPLTWSGTTATYQSVKDAVSGKGHADNITNFADRPLADAVEAMQPQ